MSRSPLLPVRRGQPLPEPPAAPHPTSSPRPPHRHTHRVSLRCPMETDVDTQGRRISLEATARYVRTIGAGGTNPGLPQVDHLPPLPHRTSLSRPSALGLSQSPPPPPPHRDPPPTTVVPPPPHRDLRTLGTGPRNMNQYVDTPHVALPVSHNRYSRKSSEVTNNNTLNGQSGRSERQQPAIVAQPTSAGGLKKDIIPEDDSTTGSEAACQESIICSQCGKCRCRACTQPRELPRKWLCDKKCECSLQKAVEVCSCMCCVRGLFYHCCTGREEEVSPTDDPCACCDHPHCPQRWTALAAMAVVLPCLCLYWPLRCGLTICTSCYNRCRQRGCHCRRDKLPGSKGLLLDSESSST